MTSKLSTFGSEKSSTATMSKSQPSLSTLRRTHLFSLAPNLPHLLTQPRLPLLPLVLIQTNEKSCPRRFYQLKIFYAIVNGFSLTENNFVNTSNNTTSIQTLALLFICFIFILDSFQPLLLPYVPNFIYSRFLYDFPSDFSLLK